MFYSEKGKRDGLVEKGRGPWQSIATIILFNENFGGNCR
jgi:hypothetical protein